MQRTDGLESRFTEKDLGALVGTKLNRNQQYAIMMEVQ